MLYISKISPSKIEGVPFRGKEYALSSKIKDRQTPPSHLWCATSSNLEEEIKMKEQRDIHRAKPIRGR